MIDTLSSQHTQQAIRDNLQHILRNSACGRTCFNHPTQATAVRTLYNDDIEDFLPRLEDLLLLHLLQIPATICKLSMRADSNFSDDVVGHVFSEAIQNTMSLSWGLYDTPYPSVTTGP